MAVIRAPKDWGEPSTPTRIVSRPSALSWWPFPLLFDGRVLTTSTSLSALRATRSQTEPIWVSRTRPMPITPSTVRS